MTNIEILLYLSVPVAHFITRLLPDLLPGVISGFIVIIHNILVYSDNKYILNHKI